MNVLLITLDTTRADRLGCYGYNEALTPAMDSIARDGVLFVRAYATAPLTLPSHASLFTGLYNPEHGITTNGRGKYSAPNLMLSDVLAAADYQTAAFVASFVLDARFGLNRGFQVYDDEIRDTSHKDDVLHRERNGAAVVDSELPGVRLMLCEALRKAGRGEEAIPYLNEELRRDPRSVPARMNLAAIVAIDQPQQAVQLLMEAQRLNPGNPHISFQMGEVRLSQNQPAEAIACFEMTQRLMPNHPDAAAALKRAQDMLQGEQLLHEDVGNDKGDAAGSCSS